MAEPEDSKKRHLLLQGWAQGESFRSPGQAPNPHVPERDRESHGGRLREQAQQLHNEAEQVRRAQEEAGLEDGLGIQIEFESFPDIELAFWSLEREGSGIELLNVRQEGGVTYATVFVPDGKLVQLERRIDDYLRWKTDKNGRAADHRKLIDAIREIRKASLWSLWTDDPNIFPDSEEEPIWWEAWLPIRKDRAATRDTFRELAQELEMRVAPGSLEFPERTVLLLHASAARLRQSMQVINHIAELRRAKETAEFFDSLPPEEHPEWVQEAQERIQFPPEDQDTPYACVLDTGVNRGHPLLQPAVAQEDLHSVEPGWGVDDQDGHGTAMAGLALYGDWTPLLSGRTEERLEHRLESVKLLPQDGQNSGGPQLHGDLTVQGVLRPEISDPSRRRVFSLMLSAEDNRDRGRPSAWSAALDKLAADQDGQGENPRLFVVAAGNIREPETWADSPASNLTEDVHDPGQSWNAVTVGAYTRLVRITESDTDSYAPIAPDGGLSPFSTTSVTWGQSHWPLKPDVVFEGGNAAKDSLGAVWMPSLRLLTAHHHPHERLFETANATSAATALAARMAAHIRAAYPDFWPETVRALMVHSAEWTEAMRREFLPNRNPTKQDYLNLVRSCGFGVPDTNRALWSAADSLTLIAQERIQPFKCEGQGNQPTAGDMNLHRLPWPAEELEALGETRVEMRVTLSYFIEPNPSRRGVRSRYRYESHALRFDVKRAWETEDEFRARKNVEARSGEEERENTESDPNWLIGPKNRHKGSLHADIWRGAAADLAGQNVLAVFPATGWWKTRTRQQRYNDHARYTLVVSIRAPEIGVDLYTPVAEQIDAAVAVST